MFKLNLLVSRMSKQIHFPFNTPLLKLKNRLKVIMTSLLILFVVIGFTALKNSEFIKADTCLDSGGRFNYEQGQCEY
ncbi:hypothetical protein OA92_20785 [Marinomonas sp. SBI22]|nr:hypothetical protein OA92_20785 [Marinomonas sp. SBI22]KZM40126.1 hypothetical protein OA91_20075 [Marinomonas sp. SBI8L]